MQQDGWPGFRAGIVGIIIGGLLMTAFPVSGAVGDFLQIGQKNAADARTRLTGNVNSANLQIINRGSGAALDLRVGPGEPPLRVNRARKVPNLNADRVDGMHAQEVIDSPSCIDGHVFARAFVRADLVSATEWSSDGVLNAFTCNGRGVRVKNIAVGTFDVVVEYGGDDGTIGVHDFNVALVTPNQDGLTASTSGLVQCSPSIPPAVLCYAVRITNPTGAPVNASFSILIV